MPVIGIDQSLRHTGIFWLEDSPPGSVPSFGFGQLDTDPRVRGAPRLLAISNYVKKVVKEVQPTLVALEGYSYGSVGKVFELGELGGALKVLLAELEVPVITPSPMQVKKFITGRATAEKEDVVHAVNKVFGLAWTLKDNNRADAATLALIAKAYLEPATLNTRHQAEVIAILRGEVRMAKKKRRPPRNKFPKI